MRTGYLVQAGMALGGVLVLGLALWPATTTVDTAPVARGAMEVTIDNEGVTRVQERFVVAAPVAGRLDRIEWEPGDVIHRGVVLARLRSADVPLADARTRAEWQATLRSAEAAHEQAQAERARARSTRDRLRLVLERQTALASAGAVSTDDVDAARTSVASADAELAAAEAAVSRAWHDVELARARLTTPSAAGRIVTVTAPCDGVVLRRLHESESVIGAGEPLIELGNRTALEIVTDLLSSDAVKALPGARVLIDDWGGEGVLEGTVRRVEPAGFMKVSALGVEEQRVNVIVAFPGDAAVGLGDGYRVMTRIVVWSATGAIKAPIGSVFRQGDRWAAFVVTGGRAHLQTIRVGHHNDNDAEILEGLAPGDEVILHPSDDLADGARVRPRASAIRARTPADSDPAR
jgi:HlyD family secretion protein